MSPALLRALFALCQALQSIRPSCRGVDGAMRGREDAGAAQRYYKTVATAALQQLLLRLCELYKCVADGCACVLRPLLTCWCVVLVARPFGDAGEPVCEAALLQVRWRTGCLPPHVACRA